MVRNKRHPPLLHCKAHRRHVCDKKTATVAAAVRNMSTDIASGGIRKVRLTSCPPRGRDGHGTSFIKPLVLTDVSQVSMAAFLYSHADDDS